MKSLSNKFIFLVILLEYFQFYFCIVLFFYLNVFQKFTINVLLKMDPITWMWKDFL